MNDTNDNTNDTQPPKKKRNQTKPRTVQPVRVFARGEDGRFDLLPEKHDEAEAAEAFVNDSAKGKVFAYGRVNIKEATGEQVVQVVRKAKAKTVEL